MEKRLSVVSEVLLWAGIVLGIITLMTMLIGTTTGATARWGFRGAITCATLAIACFLGSYLAGMIYKDQQAEKALMLRKKEAANLEVEKKALEAEKKEAQEKALALELANKKTADSKKAKAKQKKLRTTVTTTEAISGNVA